MKKIANLKFFLFTLIFIFLFFMTLVFIPYNIIDVKTPIEVVNLDKQVVAGTSIVLAFQYQKFKDYPEYIIFQLVNGSDIILETYQSNLELTKKDIWDEKIKYIHTPSSIRAGRYHIRMVIVYRPNYIRQITETFNSEDFIILPDTSEQTLNNILKLLKDVLTNQYKQLNVSTNNNKILKNKLKD